MESSYIREKISQALHGMVIGNGELRPRLIDAAMASHTIMPGSPHKFQDPALAGLWADWWSSITWREARDEKDGTIQSTIEQMTDAEARQAAEDLYDIHSKVFP